jgi:hypothetical protein
MKCWHTGYLEYTVLASEPREHEVLTYWISWIYSASTWTSWTWSADLLDLLNMKWQPFDLFRMKFWYLGSLETWLADPLHLMNRKSWHTCPPEHKVTIIWTLEHEVLTQWISWTYVKLPTHCLSWTWIDYLISWTWSADPIALFNLKCPLLHLLSMKFSSGGRRCSVTKQYQMYTATGLYKIESCGVCSYPVFKALRRTCSRYAGFF